MIAGILGMLAAVVIFILIALFSAKQPNPTIAVPLGNFLASQGFAPLDPASAPFKDIANILSWSMVQRMQRMGSQRMGSNEWGQV